MRNSLWSCFLRSLAWRRESKGAERRDVRHSNMLLIHFHFCQIGIKLYFYHLPPVKFWLTSSNQIAFQNTLSMPLAMKCLYFFFSTHSFMQHSFLEYPLPVRQESKSYLSQSSSCCPTSFREIFLISDPSIRSPSFECQGHSSLLSTQHYFSSHWTTDLWQSCVCDTVLWNNELWWKWDEKIPMGLVPTSKDVAYYISVFFLWDCQEKFLSYLGINGTRASE